MLGGGGCSLVLCMPTLMYTGDLCMLELRYWENDCIYMYIYTAADSSHTYTCVYVCKYITNKIALSGCIKQDVWGIAAHRQWRNKVQQLFLPHFLNYFVIKEEPLASGGTSLVLLT